METLNEIWPFVETYGIPILAVLGGLGFFSLNFHFIDCYNLSLMEDYINKHQSLKGFKEQKFPLIGIFAVFYSFKNLSKLDPELLKIRVFKEKVQSIKGQRKTYAYFFPILLALATVGIALNEIVIDK